jgi:Ca-activated chloride channel family protein
MRLVFPALTLLAAPAKACGVALVLAVDVSGSINQEEYSVQMNGLAEALQDPTVLDAILTERAALALIQWSGARRQHVSLPWTAPQSPDEVRDLAALVRTLPREWTASSTALGPAMAYAGDYFAGAPSCDRRVIDVSGDGPSNEGLRAREVRDLLVARGMTINGIAIEDAAIDVSDYYEANVIGGEGAFVLTAESYADYPRAILRKLLAELARPSA